MSISAETKERMVRLRAAGVLLKDIPGIIGKKISIATISNATRPATSSLAVALGLPGDIDGRRLPRPKKKDRKQPTNKVTAWQLRKKQAGQCERCGKPSAPFSSCEFHRALKKAYREHAKTGIFTPPAGYASGSIVTASGLLPFQRRCLSCGDIFETTLRVNRNSTRCLACRSIRAQKPEVVQPARDMGFPFIVGSPTEDHDLILRVNKCVPWIRDAQLRADLCQEILLEVLSGNLAIAEFEANPYDIIRKHRAKFVDRWNVISYDSTIGGDGRPLLDSLFLWSKRYRGNDTNDGG